MKNDPDGINKGFTLKELKEMQQKLDDAIQSFSELSLQQSTLEKKVESSDTENAMPFQISSWLQARLEEQRLPDETDDSLLLRLIKGDRDPQLMEALLVKGEALQVSLPTEVLQILGTIMSITPIRDFWNERVIDSKNYRFHFKYLASRDNHFFIKHFNDEDNNRMFGSSRAFQHQRSLSVFKPDDPFLDEKWRQNYQKYLKWVREEEAMPLRSQQARGGFKVGAWFGRNLDRFRELGLIYAIETSGTVVVDQRGDPIRIRQPGYAEWQNPKYEYSVDSFDRLNYLTSSDLIHSFLKITGINNVAPAEMNIISPLTPRWRSKVNNFLRSRFMTTKVNLDAIPSTVHFQTQDPKEPYRVETLIEYHKHEFIHSWHGFFCFNFGSASDFTHGLWRFICPDSGSVIPAAALPGEHEGPRRSSVVIPQLEDLTPEEKEKYLKFRIPIESLQDDLVKFMYKVVERDFNKPVEGEMPMDELSPPAWLARKPDESYNDNIELSLLLDEVKQFKRVPDPHSFIRFRTGSSHEKNDHKHRIELITALVFTFSSYVAYIKAWFDKADEADQVFRVDTNTLELRKSRPKKNELTGEQKIIFGYKKVFDSSVGLPDDCKFMSPKDIFRLAIASASKRKDLWMPSWSHPDIPDNQFESLVARCFHQLK